MENYFTEILILAQFFSLKIFSKVKYYSFMIFPGGGVKPWKVTMVFGPMCEFPSSSLFHLWAYVKNLLTPSLSGYVRKPLMHS